jgi:hypothetical protein
MHRLTARLLLLFAIVGTFAPVALSASAPPAHACCVRKAHHCHDSESEQLSLSNSSCCNRNGGRAITLGRSAQAQPRAAVTFTPDNRKLLAPSSLESLKIEVSQFHSSRAPPRSS